MPYLEKEPVIHPTAYIAPGAVVMGDVEIGEQSSVWFKCVLRGDVNFIRIGRRTSIQDLSMCHVMRDEYPLIVGDDVTVAHHCCLHGCTIGNRVLIGMSAVVLNGAVIGNDSIIAAGSVVSEGMEVPPRSLVAGIPGKVKKEVGSREMALIKKYANNYRMYGQEYKRRNPQPIKTPVGIHDPRRT
jgi:carbonic anhydrase/acetyltransferase-like protein (isoleucine patch superfamily)